MPLTELLLIAGALTAPAFFLLFALAALGSPLLALVCLLSGQLYSTQYIEAYVRKLLRMALTASVPALLSMVMVSLLLMRKTPWVVDWIQASPVGPGFFATTTLAFFASLLTLRLATPSPRQRRQGSPIFQTLILTALAMSILWLALVLVHGLLVQAKAVLQTPVSEGLAVAPLIAPNTSALPSLLWMALAALVPLCTACASVLSLEYLLLIRDREPFGREALTQMLRVAARYSLRSTMVTAAFLPVLWTHLPEMSTQPEGRLPAQALLGLAAGLMLLLVFSAGYLSRNSRPWSHSFAIHLSVFAIWLCLAAHLSVGLLWFYGA